jgi:hypothetical protein
VQEEDRAWPKVPAGALDDRRGAWLGRIEDAAIPAADAVAEAADDVAEPGAAHAVWGPEEANRGPPRCGDDRLLGCQQLRAQSGWGAEGEQAVVVAVACDLVAVGEELPEHLRGVARAGAEDEEGRPVSALGEQPAYRRGEAGVGAIVEGEREAAGFITYSCGSSEQRSGRRERPDQVGHRQNATDEDEDGARAEQPVGDPSSCDEREGEETAGQPGAALAHRYLGAGCAARARPVFSARSRSYSSSS